MQIKSLHLRPKIQKEQQTSIAIIIIPMGNENANQIPPSPP